MIGSLLRRGVVRAIVGLTVAAVATAAGALYANDLTTAAGSPRPWFQLPFPCGEAWSLETYSGHDDYDIDFIAGDGRSAGRAVLASAAGTVAWAGWSGKIGGVPAAPGTVGTDIGLGYGVTLEHEGGWFTVYGHMMAPPVVLTGQTVAQGQLLGNVGKTGATRTEHLHYEQFDDSLDPGRRRGTADKVQSYFNGIPSGITTDGHPDTGPLFIGGPKSVNQTRVSANCGGPALTTAPGPLLAADLGGTMRIYRWPSGGAAFAQPISHDSTDFDLTRVGDRMAAGDVDGDGRTDLVLAHQNASGSMSFHVYSGGAAPAVVWYTSATFNLASVGGRMVVADFTGDGKAEPAVVMDTGNNTMTIVRWTSTGKSFDSYVTYPIGSLSAGEVDDRVAAGDVDGDGRADLVLAHEKPGAGASLSVVKDAYQPMGTWAGSIGIALSGVASRLVVADFTGDGKAEPCLVADRGNGDMEMVHWVSTGTSFGDQSTHPAGPALVNVGGRVAAADVNADRRADLIVAHQNPDATLSFSVFSGGKDPAAVWATTAITSPSAVTGRLVMGIWSS